MKLAFVVLFVGACSARESLVSDTATAGDTATIDSAVDSFEAAVIADTTIEEVDTVVHERAEAPTFTPAPGAYGGSCTSPIGPSVEMKSVTPGATIYFTTDGKTPSTSSPRYLSPIVVHMTTTFRAFAVAPGFDDSEVVAAVYEISVPAASVVPVTFDPPGGAYATDQTVTLHSPTPGATICYTTDGSDPTCSYTATEALCKNGAKYSAPLPVVVAAPGTQLSALACKLHVCGASITRASYSKL